MPPLAFLLVPLPYVRIDYLVAFVAIVAVPCRFYGTHKVLKWPIFMLLFFLMFIDFVAYALVRFAIYLLTPPEPEPKGKGVETKGGQPAEPKNLQD